jgi:dTDP-4-dehydrorhamnose 3,5-epimerase
MIRLEDFTDDDAWDRPLDAFHEVTVANQIQGVRLHRLVCRPDSRGDLTVLSSDHFEPGFSAPHVYLVTAASGSIRAWVYHKRQSDRLAYTNGQFRVVLYDARPGSPTMGVLNLLDVGAANRILLTIPPFVIHGVQNRGDAQAHFVNMPTRAYDPSRPDKSRLPHGHPGIPYVFD